MRAIGEEFQAGDFVRLKTASELRRSPGPTAPTQGKLPEGTVVTYEGQEEKGFVSVSVELEDGSVKTGWVLEDQIESSTEKAPLKSLQEAEKEKPQVRRKKVEVPEDEALLLKRETSFFYGIQGGPAFTFLTPASNGFFYSAIAFTAGGFVGTMLSKDFPARIEVNFAQKNGESADDRTILNFNFLEVAAVGTYQMKKWELDFGLQYAFGLGLSAVPRGTRITGASDLSYPGIVVGAAYRFDGGAGLSYGLRLRYDLGFVQDPILCQGVSLVFSLQFSG